MQSNEDDVDTILPTPNASKPPKSTPNPEADPKRLHNVPLCIVPIDDDALDGAHVEIKCPSGGGNTTAGNKHVYFSGLKGLRSHMQQCHTHCQEPTDVPTFMKLYPESCRHVSPEELAL